MMYIDPPIRVHSNVTCPSKGIICVSFKRIALSMSLVEASELAANIQKEIRQVEQEHPELTLQVGDVVLVRDDEGNEAEYTVRAVPWQLGHGAWVIGLAGISGGYSIDRIIGIVSKVKPFQEGVK